ncbi:ATP-binding protein [Desulfobacterales bacterium HSG16]|nr:ATP-binding protein [Desulfobacterales bacterium HSG16]
MPVNLNNLIEDSIKCLQDFTSPSINIIQNIPHAVKPILADSPRIYEVIIHLHSNAIDAMSENGGVLEISLAEIALGYKKLLCYNIKPGNYVEMTVSDTGCGIDPNDMDRIFDPYYTTKDVGKGVGMGLAAVQVIVKDHGGYIFARNRVNEGSIFTVFLPVFNGTDTDVILSRSAAR